MSSSTAYADDAVALEQYLARLGLADLRLHHLERTLERTTDAIQRSAFAKLLADAYADQMLAAADDEARFEQLKASIERLLANYPQVSTPVIQVVLLQADYQRAEALVIRWLDEPTDQASLNEAAEILRRIAPQLLTQQKALAESASEATDDIESLPTAAQAAAEREATRLLAASSRAAYFAGWSQYYLGVVKQSPTTAQSEFKTAKAMFLRVLDIGDEDNYAGVESDGLGLESLWRTRAVIGLGLSEIGLNRLDAAGKCFEWLEHPSTPPMLRDQAAYWHVQGLLNVGKYADAAQFAESQVAQFTGAASPGKNSLCIAVIRAGASLPAAQAEERNKLIEPGIRGLARMRQFDSLATLMTRYKLDSATDATGFYLTWLRGRQQFLAAEKTKAPEDYAAAQATLAAALAHPQAKTELADAGQCRYYLAWCQFRLGQLTAAARGFQEAVTALRAALPDIAAQSAWMQCVCLEQIAAADKKQLAAAMTALQTLIADFPASEQATKAEFALTRIRQSQATPLEAIAALAAVKPSDPNYASALYEICQLRYQLWTKAKADAQKAKPLADDLLSAVDKLLAVQRPEAAEERNLKAALLAVDVLFAAKEPDLRRIAAYLSSGEAALAASAASPAAVEFHYRRLQLAQRNGDTTAVNAAAAWITENGAGTPYELPALIIAAREADRAVETASPDQLASRRQDAINIYARLARHVGDSPAAIANGKNALAVNSRLAQYDEDLGRWNEAAQRLNNIAEALPSDRRYLRRAGIANFHAGKFDLALECWRKLLLGLESGSEPWLEAKYYQLVCLNKTDPATAQKVWKQFNLLYPEVMSAEWKNKFAALQQQIPQ